MESQRNAIEDSEITLDEVEYWEDSGMFYYDTFQEYLTSTGKIMKKEELYLWSKK